MGKFNGFLDNIADGLTNPKGNLGVWAHARRLYVDDNLRLAPKQKFLYHCHFTLDPVVRSIIPDLVDKHNLEIGMLVKSAELPKYSAAVETKNKYNRKKNIQTNIQYEPITITFHDDNFGVTTALLEAYYRYYFADANYGTMPGAYSKTAGGMDNTYLGSGRNQDKFGLDNNISVPFFQNIQISQMARKSFTTHTLVNPIITNWQHDSLDNGDGSTTLVNTITLLYEAVWYDRGEVQAGANGSPKGFGSPDHYDRVPSPITIIGGGQLGLGGIFGTAIDLYDYIMKGKNFSNPLQAGLAAVNLIGNIRNLSKEGLRQEGFNLLTKAIGSAAGVDVSGVQRTFFPKSSNGGGKAKDLAIATAVVAGGSFAVNAFQKNQARNGNAKVADSLGFKSYQKTYQTAGGTGGVNGAKTSWENLNSSDKQTYINEAIGT